MIKYQVLENGKPADCHNFKLHHSWDKSKFDSLEEAIAYLLNYFSPYIREWHGIDKLEYQQDCFAEIREIEE